jgi:hypothetical protein
MDQLREMVELFGAELDLVAGGQNGNGFGLGGLVGAGVGIGSISLLDNAQRVVSVDHNTVTISDFLNGNAIPIGVAAAVLGTTVQSLRALA